MADPQEQHILMVSFPAQGHINPSLQLAKRLARLGCRVTFSTAAHAHRLMTISSLPPLLSCSPFSVAKYDDDCSWETLDKQDYVRELKSAGSRSLAELAHNLAAAGRPVTCVVYNFLVPWAAAVARDLGVSSALYWIQSAAVFGLYHQYFNGSEDFVKNSDDKDPLSPLHLPGLPALCVRDIPSLLSCRTKDDELFFPSVKDLFKSSGAKSRVLVNTFEALEKYSLRAAEPVELVPIGPTLPSALGDGADDAETSFGGDLFKADSKEKYMAWLDLQPAGSVVYVSFGSFSVLPVKDREEISRALEESSRKYFWVARGEREGVGESERGIVVEWCSQVEVLAHAAVGCFLTHCGWNSTLESLICGVPMVGLPQWTDQPANCRLAETAWGMGVRAEVNADGQLEAAELRRCLDLVMGEGEREESIRRSAREWGVKAREALKRGGSSDRNLRAFVGQLVS